MDVSVHRNHRRPIRALHSAPSLYCGVIMRSMLSPQCFTLHELREFGYGSLPIRGEAQRSRRSVGCTRQEQDTAT